MSRTKIVRYAQDDMGLRQNRPSARTDSNLANRAIASLCRPALIDLSRTAVVNSIQTPHAWQLASVSRMGRVTSFALVALAVDAVLARNSLSSVWIVAAIAAVSLVLAVRVVRGFPRALAAAAATFAAAGAIGLVSSTRPLVPVAILGIFTALLAVQRENAAPTIELSRTNRDGPEPVVIRR